MWLEEREQVELELREAVRLYPEDSVYAALLENVLTQPAPGPPPQCISPQSAPTAQPVLSAPGHCQAPRLLIAPKDNKDSYYADPLEEIRSDNVGLPPTAQPVPSAPGNYHAPPPIGVSSSTSTQATSHPQLHAWINPREPNRPP